MPVEVLVNHCDVHFVSTNVRNAVRVRQILDAGSCITRNNGKTTKTVLEVQWHVTGRVNRNFLDRCASRAGHGTVDHLREGSTCARDSEDTTDRNRAVVNIQHHSIHVCTSHNDRRSRLESADIFAAGRASLHVHA